MGVLGPRINIASPFFRVTTDDRLILAQRVEMALDTRPGTYWKSPDYGFCFEDLLNAGISAEAFTRIAASIKAALQADVFFREAQVVVAITAATQRPGGVALSAAITIALPEGEPQRVNVQLTSEGAVVLQ